MRNITLFSVPKPFTGKFDVIQRNAIQSWLALDPTPEVILCGKAPGVAEATIEFGIKHLPNIEVSAGGTPLINSVFLQSGKATVNAITSYLNSDIILTKSFLDAVDEVSSKLKKFMIIGQRWDIDDLGPIIFSEASWEKKLHAEVRERGQLHAPCGLDYFVFEKGVGTNLPPLIIGRTGWDGWFAAMALHYGFNVVDASKKIFVVHQNHNFSFTDNVVSSYKVKENMLNRKLIGEHRAFTTDATWLLDDTGLVPTKNFEKWKKKSSLRSTKQKDCDVVGFPKYKNSKSKIVISIGCFGAMDVAEHILAGHTVVAYDSRKEVYDAFLGIGSLKFAPFNLSVSADEEKKASVVSIRSVLEKFHEVVALYINCGEDEIPIILNTPVDLFLGCKRIVVEFHCSTSLISKCLKRWAKYFTFSKPDAKLTYTFVRRC